MIGQLQSSAKQLKMVNPGLWSTITLTVKCLFIYLLLTEFEVRTVSYGPSFFPFDLWPNRAWAINRMGKNEDP